jgi:anti-anti-sigma regulatory factor
MPATGVVPFLATAARGPSAAQTPRHDRIRTARPPEDHVTAQLFPPARRGAALTETVDARTGLIRASGHLTSQGADLLSGTADHLRDHGHSRVTLDLRDVRAVDDAGLDILRDLRSTFEAAGDKLLIRYAPELAGERA